uniref:EF-hand domain-containing protein n=1 Tax=Populus trichocarpa TaxID=3694 RepID=A0A3N7G445_POPTR
MNILIMWFPQFNEELKHIRGVFEQYDEDVNGSIDLEELKKCLQKLTLTLKEEEVEDLFHSCDIDNSMSSMFLEVIYLLVEHSSSPPKSIHLKLDFIFIHMFDLKTSTYCDHPYMMA